MKTAFSQQFTGSMLVLVSAAAFGGMAIFARIAYAEGVEPFSLLFLRFTIASLIMLMIVSARRIPLPRGKVLGGYALMGAVGYVGQSSSFFTALKFASAGLVALLLYLYPVLVTLIEVLIEKKPLTRIKVVALVLSLFGTVLTIGPQLEGKLTGVLLGISAAVIYSIYIIVGNHLIGEADVLASTTVIMGSAAIVFGAIVSSRGLHLPVTIMGWLAVFAIIIISTIIAMVTFLAGLERVGATNAALLSTFEPVTTIFLAWLILGEPITLLRVAGGILILGAVVLLTKGDIKNSSRQQETLESK